MPSESDVLCVCRYLLLVLSHRDHLEGGDEVLDPDRAVSTTRVVLMTLDKFSSESSSLKMALKLSPLR